MYKIPLGERGHTSYRETNDKYFTNEVFMIGSFNYTTKCIWTVDNYTMIDMVSRDFAWLGRMLIATGS